MDAGDAAAAALGSAAGKSAPTYRGSRLVCARAAPPSPAPPAPGGEAVPGEFAPLPARLEKRVPPAEEAARSCAAALSPVMPNFSSENVGRAPSGCGACGVTSSRWGLTNAEAPSLRPPAAEDADAPAVVALARLNAPAAGAAADGRMRRMRASSLRRNACASGESAKPRRGAASCIAPRSPGPVPNAELRSNARGGKPPYPPSPPRPVGALSPGPAPTPPYPPSPKRLCAGWKPPCRRLVPARGLLRVRRPRCVLDAERPHAGGRARAEPGPAFWP